MQASYDVCDVRDSMKVLPQFTQHFLSWLTGKPLAGQRPLFQHTQYRQLTSGLIWLLFGISLSTLLATLPKGWVLLPISWLITVGGARRLQVQICHQCVHHNFTGNLIADRIVCEIISTVLLIQDYSGYREDHVHIHHGNNLATSNDPDMIFLTLLGFSPGMRVSKLWMHLITTMFSPKFHGAFLYYRLRANFVTAPLYRRLMSVIYSCTLLAIVLSVQWGVILLVVCVIPLTVIYHVSALLQFVCEHRWLNPKDLSLTPKDNYGALTFGRFCGSVVPQGKDVVAWSFWWLKMLAYHLPVRAAVLVADLPAHDLHHRLPMLKSWPEAIFIRQQMVTDGCPGWARPFEEVWGLHQAIQLVFMGLSNLPATGGEAARKGTGSIAKKVLEM